MDLTLLNDEDLIHTARYINVNMLNVDNINYLSERLNTLGYTIEYGCCGRNTLRMKQYERHTSISTP